MGFGNPGGYMGPLITMEKRLSEREKVGGG